MPDDQRLPVTASRAEIIGFLRGYNALDGRWFGDREPGLPSYWWRDYLHVLEESYVPSDSARQPPQDAMRDEGDLHVPGGLVERQAVLDVLAAYPQAQVAVRNLPHARG